MTALEYIKDTRERCVAQLELVAELCEMKAAQIRDAASKKEWNARARFYERQALALKELGEATADERV